MKKQHRTLCGILLAGCLVCPLAAGFAIPPKSALTAYAGDTDFSWGTYKNKAAEWFGSTEAVSIADSIVQFQLSDGGWRKDMANTGLTGSWAKSTIDNNATWGQIRFLACTYTQTKNGKYKDSCLRGIDLLIRGQYENGGWPQVFGDPGTYHAHITYNDSAMIAVMQIMQDIVNKTSEFAFVDDNRTAQAKNALDKGIECILNTQIKINGELTAWGQQHDEYTLAPAGARAYELPSVCTSESCGIVTFLYNLPEKDERITRSINAAIAWFEKVAIYDTVFDWNSDKSDKVVTHVPGAGPIWTRFYTLDTSVPMFSDRDGKVYYDVMQISQERRTGYAWYGSWPASVIALGQVPEELPEYQSTLVSSLIPTAAAYPEKWAICENLADGAEIYSDRAFTYIGLPNPLLGAEYIMLPCDAKKTTTNLAELTAAGNITVWVGLDQRLRALPAWVDGWKETGLSFDNSDGVTYSLYTTDLKADETLTLGANGQSDYCVNYTVMITPQEKLSGDVTLDGFVNRADAEALVQYLLAMEGLTPEQAEQADLNADGILTATDLSLLWGLLR